MIKEILDIDIELMIQIVKIHDLIPKKWSKQYKSDIAFIESDIKRIITGLKNKTILLLIDIVNNKLCGYIWAEPDHENIKRLEIISLWVAKEKRCHGLATTLKNKLEQLAIKKDYLALTSTVYEGNNKMLKLNKELGYTTVYYKMEKKLKGET